MRMRSRRRNLVVWSASGRDTSGYRVARPLRGRRIRRGLRIGTVLAVIGAAWLVRMVLAHWRPVVVVPGGVLIVVGFFVLSNDPVFYSGSGRGTKP